MGWRVATDVPRREGGGGGIFGFVLLRASLECRVAIDVPHREDGGGGMFGFVLLRVSLECRAVIDGLHREGGGRLLRAWVCCRSGWLSRNHLELYICRPLSTVSVLLHLEFLFHLFFIWLFLLRLDLYRAVDECRLLGGLFVFWLYLRRHFSFLFPWVRKGYRQVFGGLFFLWGFRDVRRQVCGGFTQEI